MHLETFPFTSCQIASTGSENTSFENKRNLRTSVSVGRFPNYSYSGANLQFMNLFHFHCQWQPSRRPKGVNLPNWYTDRNKNLIDSLIPLQNIQSYKKKSSLALWFSMTKAVQLFSHIYTYAYTYAYIYTYAYTYKHIYIHTHTSPPICWLETAAGNRKLRALHKTVGLPASEAPCRQPHFCRTTAQADTMGSR